MLSVAKASLAIGIAPKLGELAVVSDWWHVIHNLPDKV